MVIAFSSNFRPLFAPSSVWLPLNSVFRIVCLKDGESVMGEDNISSIKYPATGFLLSLVRCCPWLKSVRSYCGLPLRPQRPRHAALTGVVSVKVSVSHTCTRNCDPFMTLDIGLFFTLYRKPQSSSERRSTGPLKYPFSFSECPHHWSFSTYWTSLLQVKGQCWSSPVSTKKRSFSLGKKVILRYVYRSL